MKIAIPENVTNSLRFKVGDLYAAGGNSSNTAFWLVVAKHRLAMINGRAIAVRALHF